MGRTKHNVRCRARVRDFRLIAPELPEFKTGNRASGARRSSVPGGRLWDDVRMIRFRTATAVGGDPRRDLRLLLALWPL